MITQELLKEYFEYKDGNLYWKKNDFNHKRIKIGKKAGYKCKNGYTQIGLFRKVYFLHRLIFIYHYGYTPNIIDHIDNDKSNNKIENLRNINRQENNINVFKKKNNSSGVKGVSFNKRLNKWTAYINVNKKRVYTKLFETLEEAKFEVQKERIKYHGKYANNG
ncbi:HNH endonuclease [Flavobacterium sp.]|jgi:hypothetical protein|uniref:HNH endonuclease n=1 Tax=Flavobacterium sp. TaxID=239 RepID=UPI0037C0B50B